MSSTCLLCYQENQFFVLPPCNHRQICWKCCLKLMQGSIFSCPFCKNKPQIKSQLLFVTKQEMLTQDHAVIMKSNPFRSNKNTYYFYSCKAVAEFIQQQTSFYCTICLEVHQNMNQLKKHLYQTHKRQYCDVCLDNRKCIINQQKLYLETQILIHMKQGDISQTGQIVLYHPSCDFCNRRFYDLDSFKLHLKMSSHMKCQICQINSTKLKYVYYKNYEDLQRHHKKTHFVCDIGQCIGRKLQNVFASQSLLQQHKKRCHRKYKGDKHQKVQNILLGFNKQEQQLITFDGIGKNLQKQFTVFQRQGKVDKQDHLDNFIDIRQFYLQMVKQYNLWRTQDIIKKTIQLSEFHGYRCQQAKLVDIPIFKPMQMSSLTRVQCQRIIKRCFNYKDAQVIIDIFFTKRNQYNSCNEYFFQIQKRMRNTSIFAFYMIFPQLIRFMKDENKTKLPMDEYYSLKLRLLNVSKKFTFHFYDKYSKLFEFLKGQIQSELISRCEKGQVDIEKYCKYLKDMNFNYYLQNQDDLFYIPKQKVTNLYHMIERCKTKDLLKLNWLLKIGFPQGSYQNVINKFLYKTVQECQHQSFKIFTIKQLALIHLYAKICLEALKDSFNFQNNKKNARAYYFTYFLDGVKRPNTISMKVYEEIRSLEGHSHAIQKKVKHHPIKVYSYDEDQCPSLLSVPIQSKTNIPIKNQPVLELGIGKSRLPIWNEESLIKKKVPIDKKVKIEQFPTLSGPQQSINTKNSKQVNKKDQQQFPVFNFKQKFVHSKKLPQKSQKSKQLSNLLSFNNKNIIPTKWDEQLTKSKFQQLNKTKIKQSTSKISDKSQKQFTPYPKTMKQEDQYIQRAMRQSLLIQNQQKSQNNKNNHKQIKKQQQPIIVKSKKDYLYQEQVNVKKIKNNKNKNKTVGNIKKQQIKQQNKQIKITNNGIKLSKNNKQIKQQSKNDEYLFQQIQKQVELSKKIKKTNFLLDWSDNENSKQQQQIQIKKQQQIKKKNKQIYFDDGDFASLTGQSSQQKQSIINRIQKQTMMPQQNKVNKVIKNKKGKKVVYQRVNLF